MTTIAPQPTAAKAPWIRIPDGTKVVHRTEGHEGVIDGLTEIVNGPTRNPDGRTQYRVNIGGPGRELAAEDDLSVLTDLDGVVLVVKQNIEYRKYVTERLQQRLSKDRFIAPK